MTKYFDELELKSRAPRASNWNRIAETFEDLNNDVPGHFLFLEKSSTQAITWPVTGLNVAVSFDTEIVDTDDIWTSGTLTLPSWVSAYRVSANIVFTSTPSIEIFAVDFNFDIGSQTTADGIESFAIMGDWTPADGGTVVQTGIELDSPAGNNVTVDNHNGTWMLIEWL